MIIPAIDLINGQVVRLYQGDYDQKTEYSSSPQARFDEYVSQGAVQPMNMSPRGRCSSIWWIWTAPKRHKRASCLC